NNTIGGIFKTIGDAFGGLVEHIPGVSSLEDLVANAVLPLLNAVISQLIPSPFSENQSGGRTFDMAAGGADGSGKDYCHNGLGCQVIKNNRVGKILNEQQQEELAQYNNQSFFARMTDTESRYSPVSKLAMAMPSNLDSARTSVANFFSNPFKGFASLGG